MPPLPAFGPGSAQKTRTGTFHPMAFTIAVTGKTHDTPGFYSRLLER